MFGSCQPHRPVQLYFIRINRMRAFVFLIGILGCLSITACHFSTQEVDLIVHNATIYQVDDAFSKAEAMAIKDGKIVAIGKEREILNAYSAKRVIDAQHQFVYPGFQDAHAHFLAYALFKNEVDLNGLKSWEAVCSKVQQHNSNRDWIIGRGWDQNLWPDQAMPDRKRLDELFPDRPVWLMRVDGHAGIANRRALELSGLMGAKGVQGGQIFRYPGGEPTGLLLDNAMIAIQKIIPAYTRIDKEQGLVMAQQACFAVGLTHITEAGLDRDEIQFLDSLQKAGVLKMPMYIMASQDKSTIAHYIKNGIDTANRQLVVRSFKYYADGALGSRGACLINPYQDLLAEGKKDFGKMLGDHEEWIMEWMALEKKGFQVCTHAIGDSANRVVLKDYAKILGGSNDKRWRIEHAQVVDQSDVPMFGQFNIIPSVQPTHATSDSPWAWQRLGRSRVVEAYKYATLLKENGMMALGTDFPIEDIDPMKTFFAAVFRKDKRGVMVNPFQLNEAITREQAIRGMTIWNAVARFAEHYSGSLEMGKDADFVMTSVDLMTGTPDQLQENILIATFIGGKEMYSKKK